MKVATADGAGSRRLFAPAAHQRRYGYYVFALPEGDCLVGRIGYSLIAIADTPYPLRLDAENREVTG